MKKKKKNPHEHRAIHAILLFLLFGKHLTVLFALFCSFLLTKKMNIWHTVDRAIRAILRFLNEAP